jgi:chromosome segregation ATPase
MRMDAETCVDIVRSCRKPWRFVYQFMQSFRNMNVMTQVKKMQEDPSASIDVGENTRDTSTRSKEVITNLRTVSNTEDEAIQFDATVESLCNDLLVHEDENPDLVGDETIVERVVSEEKKERERIEKLPATEKEQLKTEVEQRKTQRKQETEQKVLAGKAKVTELQAKITDAEAQMETSKIIITEKSTMLNQKRQMRKNASSDQEKQAIDAEIKGLMTEIDTETDRVKTMIGEVNNKIKDIESTCPAGKCTGEYKN